MALQLEPGEQLLWKCRAALGGAVFRVVFGVITLGVTEVVGASCFYVTDRRVVRTRRFGAREAWSLRLDEIRRVEASFANLGSGAIRLGPTGRVARGPTRVES